MNTLCKQKGVLIFILCRAVVGRSISIEYDMRKAMEKLVFVHKVRVILADVPSILLNSLFFRTEFTTPVNDLLMKTIQDIFIK